MAYTRHERATILTVGLGEVLVRLGFVPVTAVVPALAMELGVSAADASWILTLFILTLAGALSGCPESHGTPGTDAGTPRTDAPGTPTIDAPGTRVDAPIGPAVDAPLPPLPDAPGSCPIGSFDGFCTNTSNAAERSTASTA